MNEEFAGVADAMACIHGAGVIEGLLGGAKPGAVTQEAFVRAVRAREWLRAAVTYAQERGWPDNPQELGNSMWVWKPSLTEGCPYEITDGRCAVVSSPVKLGPDELNKTCAASRQAALALLMDAERSGEE